MSKSTIKRQNYNTQVVERIAEKWGVTTRFVTMALKGDRESETAETIKKDYKRLVKEVNNIISK